MAGEWRVMSRSVPICARSHQRLPGRHLLRSSTTYLLCIDPLNVHYASLRMRDVVGKAQSMMSKDFYMIEEVAELLRGSPSGSVAKSLLSGAATVPFAQRAQRPPAIIPRRRLRHLKSAVPRDSGMSVRSARR